MFIGILLILHMVAEIYKKDISILIKEPVFVARKPQEKSYSYKDFVGISLIANFDGFNF